MSFKRKSETPLPPAKKHRGQNGHQTPSAAKPPTTVPALPPITPDLEKSVFTHQSALSACDSSSDAKSYERLEFLGDAYLELIASRLLWNQFKDLPTGQLSKTRETLVKNETLARFSSLYGFEKRLRMNEASMQSTGASVWTKIRGDIFEAYVAAIVLSNPDDGFQLAEDWLTQLWLPLLKDVKTTTTSLKAKEELARMILTKDVRLNYVDERPRVHERKAGVETYFIGVYLTGLGWTNQHLGSGKGLNKVTAGNEAASRAMANRPLIDEIVERRKVHLEKKRELELELELKDGSGA